MAHDLRAAHHPGAAPDQPCLVDILDHVLNTGVVVHGGLVISLAGVDLIYLGLDIVLTSVETAMRRLHGGDNREELR